MPINMTPETWVPIAVFLAMTVGSWMVLGFLADRPRSAEERLRRLIDPVAARSAAESSQAKRQEVLQAKVTAAAGKLGKSLRPADQAELGKIRTRLLNAGFRQEQAVAVYYGIKFIGLIVGLSVSFPPLFLQSGATQLTWIVAAVAGAAGFYLPGFIVDFRKKRRGE